MVDEGFGARSAGKNVDLLEISQNVNNVASRLRVLEDRYANLRKKMQLSEQNILDFERDMTVKVGASQSELEALRKSFDDALHKLDKMEEELGNTVKSIDFKVIERYLDAWQPLDFVTKEELNRLLDMRHDRY